MTVFSEEQRSVKNLVWVIAMLLPAVMLAIMLFQALTGKMVGENPMSNKALLLLSALYLIPVIWVLVFVKFTTTIDAEKVSFGWNIPNNELNEIRIEEIKEWNVIRYRFVGYGYRLTRLYGVVYNVSGDMGLQIIRKDGSKVLIGTRKPDELKRVISEIQLLS
jgi:hypothetical protein